LESFWWVTTICCTRFISGQLF